jgi:hypothetical protein
MDRKHPTEPFVRFRKSLGDWEVKHKKMKRTRNEWQKRCEVFAMLLRYMLAFLGFLYVVGEIERIKLTVAEDKEAFIVWQECLNSS